MIYLAAFLHVFAFSAGLWWCKLATSMLDEKGWAKLLIVPCGLVGYGILATTFIWPWTKLFA